MKKRILLLCLVLVVIVSLEAVAMLSKPKVNFIRDGSFSAPAVSSLRQEPSLFVVKLEASPAAEERVVAEEPVKLELIGTAIGNAKDPSAFIKDLETGKQGIYKQGSRVQDAKVVKITMGKVVLDVQGKERILTMSDRRMACAYQNDDRASLITLLGDQMVVNKSRLAGESGKIIKDLQKVKVSPYYDSQKVAGMKVQGVAQDSIFAAAGIHNEDVVTMVNSQKIDSYQKALQVLNKARGQAEIKVSVLRDGQPQLLSYKFQ
jgi:type II secretion system protein C